MGFAVLAAVRSFVISNSAAARETVKKKHGACYQEFVGPESCWTCSLVAVDRQQENEYPAYLETHKQDSTR